MNKQIVTQTQSIYPTRDTDGKFAFQGTDWKKIQSESKAKREARQRNLELNAKYGIDDDNDMLWA